MLVVKTHTELLQGTVTRVWFGLLCKAAATCSPYIHSMHMHPAVLVCAVAMVPEAPGQSRIAGGLTEAANYCLQPSLWGWGRAVVVLEMQQPHPGLSSTVKRRCSNLAYIENNAA